MQIRPDLKSCKACSESARSSWLFVQFGNEKNVLFCQCSQGQAQKKITKLQILLQGDKYEPDF